MISSMWSIGDTAVLALTALERWAATRNVQPHSASEYSTILAIVLLLLLALVVLLWWVSYGRTHVTPTPARDSFSDGAARRGLGARERQMLLAIATRSGLGQSHHIFTTPDAFDQGARKLLEECARSRTAQECARLQAELAGLRERLAYRVKGKGEPVRAVARGRSDRLAVQAPATVARFPFIRAAATELTDMAPTDWFEPVSGIVTEVSGSSLLVYSPLRVQVGERVLVVFGLWPAAAGKITNDADHRGHIVGHIGRVTHRQAAGEETVMTVDLADLGDREIDELVHLTRAAGSGVSGPAAARVAQGA